jgi:hypothetical protein
MTMVYLVYAIETSTGLPFERADFGSREEAESFAASLEGYEQVRTSERYSSIDEMYADQDE